MWLANLLKRFTIFYLKLIVTLAFACVAAQMLAAWWHGVHLASEAMLALSLATPGTSLCLLGLSEILNQTRFSS